MQPRGPSPGVPCAEPPRGARHRLIIDALEANWSRFEAKGVSDLGILIDWCGLYQAPRDDEQQRVFGAALKAINQASAHPYPGPLAHARKATDRQPRGVCSRYGAHSLAPRSGTPTAAQQCGW